jgi:hypothetical protein
MPVYVVTPQVADAIADGRARILLAPARNGERNGHAACADDVFVDTVGANFGGRRRLRESVCIFRASVVLTAGGPARIVDPRYRERNAHTTEAEGIHWTLQAAEAGAPNAGPAANDALARLAGFRDYAALWAYVTDKDRRQPDDTPTRVQREVVGWAVERAQAGRVAA